MRKIRVLPGACEQQFFPWRAWAAQPASACGVCWSGFQLQCPARDCGSRVLPLEKLNSEIVRFTHTLRRAAPATLTPSKTKVFHVSRSEMLLKLRDDILQLHGFEVVSTSSFERALQQVPYGSYDLVLIDIEGENGVAEAEALCSEITHLKPDQQVAYVCNYRVAIDSDCPVSVIRAEFNPEGLVRSVREVLEKFQK